MYKIMDHLFFAIMALPETSISVTATHVKKYWAQVRRLALWYFSSEKQGQLPLMCLFISCVVWSFGYIIMIHNMWLQYIMCLFISYHVQGDLVDCIEHNVERAANYVEQGAKDAARARVYHQKNTRVCVPDTSHSSLDTQNCCAYVLQMFCNTCSVLVINN